MFNFSTHAHNQASSDASIADHLMSAASASMAGLPTSRINPIFPLHLELGRRLLGSADGMLTSTPGTAAGGRLGGRNAAAAAASLPMARYDDDSTSASTSRVDIDTEELMALQLEVSDYVATLDRTLRDLTAYPNAKLAKRLRETSDIPCTFLYFRTQQAMLKLSGDHTIQEERRMLARLSELLDA